MRSNPRPNLEKCIIPTMTAILFLVSVTTMKADDAGRLDSFPVLEELRNPARRALDVLQLEAVTDGLRQVASEAGVVLCYEDDAGSTDPAFEDACRDDRGGKKRKTPTLRWNAEVTTTASESSRRIVFLTLSMDVAGGKKKKKKAKRWPEASLLITQAEAYVPESSTVEDETLLLGKALFDLIVQRPEIYDWFLDMRNYPALLVPRPEGDFESPPMSRFATLAVPVPPPPVDEAALAARWEQEREAIVDLLLEERHKEARDRAETLLADDGLPSALAERVEELLSKAETKLAAAAPAEKPEPAAASPPVPERKPLDVTFNVRYAHTGGGFRGGVDGRLRISTRDIRFVPSDPEHGDGWSVKWPSLKDAGKAGGVWDVAHPLVIETTGGEKYYIAEITQRGRFGNGRTILEYIEKGRRGGRSARVEASGDPEMDTTRGPRR